MWSRRSNWSKCQCYHQVNRLSLKRHSHAEAGWRDSSSSCHGWRWRQQRSHSLYGGQLNTLTLGHTLHVRYLIITNRSAHCMCASIILFIFMSRELRNYALCTYVHTSSQSGGPPITDERNEPSGTGRWGWVYRHGMTGRAAVGQWSRVSPA